ncbi:hypothetical protein AB0G29_35380 [Streptomyces parvus]|uniref:hypothetical protein n=1 Tax=Streptomyces parvus TaxID=66428 RepID=UPI0033FE8A6D
MSQTSYSDSDRSVLYGWTAAAVGIAVAVVSGVVRAMVEPPLVGGALLHGALWVTQGIGLVVVFGGMFVLIRGQMRRTINRGH